MGLYRRIKSERRFSMGAALIIDEQQENWAREFCHELDLEYDKKFDIMVRMACFTMLYHIADNFSDGKFREEILQTVS